MSLSNVKFQRPKEVHAKREERKPEPSFPRLCETVTVVLQTLEGVKSTHRRHGFFRREKCWVRVGVDSPLAQRRPSLFRGGDSCRILRYIGHVPGVSPEQFP